MRIEGKTKRQLRKMLRLRDRKLCKWDNPFCDRTSVFHTVDWFGYMENLDQERKLIRIALKKHN